MTEYWVSQGNKWCEYCKMFIANNQSSIRTHEYGQKHKDNVAKKIANMRKENADKDKDLQRALKDLEKIEDQALKSYQKDLKASGAVPSASIGKNTSSTADWVYDEASGYHRNPTTGVYFDSNSGFYYSEVLGQWTSEEEAFRANLTAKPSKFRSGTPLVTKATPMASGVPIAVRGRPSSLEVGKGKRKRDGGKNRISAEEAAALAAREAAKKRIQEREKGMMGLYH